MQTKNIPIAPLAIPMLAGPGSISVDCIYSEHQETSEIIISVVAMVAVAIFFVLRSAHYLAKLLGASGCISKNSLYSVSP
jgi:multiple antibiotic resistance protein